MENFVPLDQVCREFEITLVTLRRYARVGSIRPTRRDGELGFRPHQIRRLWSILSLHRELGVNLAGVQLILRMRDRMLDIEQSHRALLRELQSRIAP